MLNGKLIILGAAAEPLQVPGIPLILGRRSVMGWPSGTSIDSQDTLNFSLLTSVRAMSEVFPLERAAEAYEHMMSGKARFRAVLTMGDSTITSHWTREQRLNKEGEQTMSEKNSKGTPTNLSGDGVEGISSNLRRLLADVFALYVKTKNFHWHISGRRFRDYHLLLDERSTQMFAVPRAKNERSIMLRKKIIMVVLISLIAGPLMAQEGKVTSLITKDLTEFSGKEGLMINVEYAPGGSDPVHRHDAHAFVYVLEGSIVMQVKGGKEVTLTPGQTFYEGPKDVHVVSRNASKTTPAKFLVFFVKDKAAPVLKPVK